MLKDKFLEILGKNLNQDCEISKAAEKIKNQKRLSSREFLKVHETIWQDGPKIKYLNPDARTEEKATA